MRAVRFSPGVEQDLDEAVAWYAARSSDAPHDFLSAFRDAVRRVGELGQAYRKVHGEFRHLKLGRFPYLMYFREDGEGFYIALVIDAARDPELVQRLLAKR